MPLKGFHENLGLVLVISFIIKGKVEGANYCDVYYLLLDELELMWTQ